ncbi:MAG: hypothetical protein AAB634_03505 [Patescibacteria group bacterium]
MDFRIQKTIENLLSSLGVSFGDFDRVSIAGGASLKNDTFPTLALSLKLHSPSLFILTAHEDCGAGTTLSDLKKALSEAKREFPEKEVRGFWIKLDGTWDKV